MSRGLDQLCLYCKRYIVYVYNYSALYNINFDSQ